MWWARPPTLDAHQRSSSRQLGPSCEDVTDWLMLAGDFVAGRVHRPAEGPRHDPHWMLLPSSPMAMPASSWGWAEHRRGEGRTAVRLEGLAGMGRGGLLALVDLATLEFFCLRICATPPQRVRPSYFGKMKPVVVDGNRRRGLLWEGFGLRFMTEARRKVAQCLPLSSSSDAASAAAGLPQVWRDRPLWGQFRKKLD
jgi:hypothetical protein